MKRWIVAMMVALPLVAASGVVAAQDAVAGRQINVRAGPGRDYPLVASFGAGTPLGVQGCTAGYGWCDVVGPDGIRGWVYAGNISYRAEQQVVPLPYYAPNIAVPIVSFALGAYWGSYYRDRPFYHYAPRYERHAPPPRAYWRPRPEYGHWDHRPPGGGYRPPPPRGGPPHGGPPHHPPPQAHRGPPPGGGGGPGEHHNGH